MADIMTDIKLDEKIELTAAATGDVPIVQGVECLLQEIRLEALTQEGELFYAPDFGWSLLDWMQREDTELNRAELDSRIKEKLSKYETVNPGTIEIEQEWGEEKLQVIIQFKQYTEEQILQIKLSLDRISVEVVIT